MEDLEIIRLTNEEGQDEEFYLLATFGVDENDYAALVSVDDDEEIILILRIDDNDEGEYILVGIDDDEELENAIDVFEELDREITE